MVAVIELHTNRLVGGFSGKGLKLATVMCRHFRKHLCLEKHQLSLMRVFKVTDGQPQGDYIELHRKRHGYRHDHFKRKHKKEAT
ncbi:hypothetical protein LOK49_LG14G00685 [Camellia lanceoleosa]|uniref:Uncharacterized protein n=1 Tax=Camellia lanceoleosa TaxID=1840588 RepID=A0ACC0F8L6_9ERIC|nr:hypothetical protein LOK49_LG14G00685 [Camellia lanceoleosa]